MRFIYFLTSTYQSFKINKALKFAYNHDIKDVRSHD